MPPSAHPRKRPTTRYEQPGCQIGVMPPPCDVPWRPYAAWSPTRAEFRITLTLTDLPVRRFGTLLSELLRVAPHTGPVVGGGTATEITMALDAVDAPSAVFEATRLAERALARLGRTACIVGVSAELAD